MACGKLLRLDALISLAVAAIAVIGSLYWNLVASPGQWAATAFVVAVFGMRGLGLLQEAAHPWLAATSGLVTAVPVQMFLLIVPSERTGSDYVVVPDSTFAGWVVLGLMFLYVVTSAYCFAWLLVTGIAWIRGARV